MDESLNFLTIGNDALKRPFKLKAKTLNQHVLVIGATGSGKTTTLYNFLDYHISCGNAQIIIDGKGDKEFLENIEKMATKTSQPFYFFSLSDPKSLHYNPFEVGSPGELTDKLMSLTDWSEEHYKLSAQRFLQLLFRIFAKNGIVPDLPLIVRHFDKKSLISMLAPQKSNKKTVLNADEFNLFSPREAAVSDPEANELIEALESIEETAIKGFKSRLGILAEGDHRELLKTKQTGVLSLQEALKKKGIVVFSLDSLKYPEQARLFGKLVVSDIKSQVTAQRVERAGESVNLLFDEFNVFVSPNVMDLVTKSRSAGFCIVLALQGFSDIDRLESGEALHRQILQNCNTVIVQRLNDPKDAEEIASIWGTHGTYLLTLQVSEQGATDLGSLRPEQEYVIHPNTLKGLKLGEAYIKYHDPKYRLKSAHVWIRNIF